MPPILSNILFFAPGRRIEFFKESARVQYFAQIVDVSKIELVRFVLIKKSTFHVMLSLFYTIEELHHSSIVLNFNLSEIIKW